MEKVGGLISILIILDLISKFLISHFNIHLDLGIISIFPIETIVGYAIDNEILSVPKLTESINTTKIIYIIFATLFASVFIFSLKQKCLFENNFLSKTARYTSIFFASGIIGNLINYIVLGFVVDFIKFNPFNDTIIIANIADIYLLIGFSGIIIAWLNIVTNKFFILVSKESNS